LDIRPPGTGKSRLRSRVVHQSRLLLAFLGQMCNGIYIVALCDMILLKCASPIVCFYLNLLLISIILKFKKHL